MQLHGLISTNNPVFSAYVFYSAILVLKMLSMAILTGRQRFAKKVFSNAEDVGRSSKAKIKFDDPDVERVRRAHLNDLENLTPFFIIGFLYVLTKPEAVLAVNLFRLVAASRIIHTIVYAVKPLPQPSRALAFLGGLAPTIYMAYCVITTFNTY